MLASEHRLFDGELVVDSFGIYTYASYFCHPETQRQVFLVGSNHIGDDKFFERIVQIMNCCDVVLYEDFHGDSSNNSSDIDEVPPKEKRSQVKRLAMDGDPVEVFPVVFRYFSLQAMKYLPNLVDEKSFFSDLQDEPHWIRADTTVDDDISGVFDEVSDEVKLDTVNKLRNLLKKIEAGTFDRRDFAEGAVVMWSHESIVDSVKNVVGTPRDLHCFEVFDKIVDSKDPDCVGIIFGAGHIAHQRKLLRKRGYDLAGKEKLCNISI